MDKRNRMPAIPEDYAKLLTPLQLMALRNIENFGWVLKFVRREGLDVPIPVVTGTDGTSYGVIEDDGRLNMTPDITIRE
ncbi:MAG: hypothetical protein ACE5EH_11860 [Gammaproteobacteria bacterium]